MARFPGEVFCGSMVGLAWLATVFGGLWMAFNP